MKKLLILLIINCVNISLYANNTQYYRGSPAGLMPMHNVYLIKNSDSTRIITTIEEYKTLLTCDTTFRGTTIQGHQFNLTERNNQLELKVDISNDIYLSYSLLHNNNYQHTFKLELCTYQEILEKINTAYLFKKLYENGSRIRCLDTPKDTIDSRWKKLVLSNVCDLSLTASSLGEKEYRNKVDSLICSFWLVCQKDSILPKQLNKTKQENKFNGLGLSFLGIGRFILHHIDFIKMA